MSDTKLVLADTHEVRFENGGVGIRKVGTVWPHQHLTYSDLKALIDLKNEAFKEHGFNLHKGELAWRKKIIEKLSKTTTPKRKRSA